jgi:hypothetical protein
MIGMIMLLPAISSAQEFQVFKSDEYAFSMKYPSTWVKIDKPQGNYYVVFQAPELTDNFRSRIHVAAHAPVKDPLDVFKQELRNGISDLQGKPPTAKEKQKIQILDEGDFKCEVPGAYYFFIQAYEDKLSMWMDIVIVFYKYEDTLLRVSCLAPSQSMDKFHALFNTVLTSVKFSQQTTAPTQAPPPAPSPAPTGKAPGQAVQPPPAAPPQQPRQVAPPTATPAPPPQVQQPVQPSEPTARPDVRQLQPVQPAPPSPAAPPGQPPTAPQPGPRGPARTPEGPPTGIVN